MEKQPLLDREANIYTAFADTLQTWVEDTRSGRHQHIAYHTALHMVEARRHLPELVEEVRVLAHSTDALCSLRMEYGFDSIVGGR